MDAASKVIQRSTKPVRNSGFFIDICPPKYDLNDPSENLINVPVETERRYRYILLS